MKSYFEKKQDWKNSVEKLIQTKPLTAEAVLEFTCAVMRASRQGSGLASQDLEAAIEQAFGKGGKGVL